MLACLKSMSDDAHRITSHAIIIMNSRANGTNSRHILPAPARKHRMLTTPRAMCLFLKKREDKKHNHVRMREKVEILENMRTRKHRSAFDRKSNWISTVSLSNCYRANQQNINNQQHWMCLYSLNLNWHRIDTIDTLCVRPKRMM